MLVLGVTQIRLLPGGRLALVHHFFVVFDPVALVGLRASRVIVVVLLFFYFVELGDQTHLVVQAFQVAAVVVFLPCTVVAAAGLA